MGIEKSLFSLNETDLKGRRVLLGVDLNVLFDDNSNISDDTRIRAAVPIIKYLIDHGAKVIISSHLGRPTGVTPKYSLKPHVPRLSELLGVEVKMADHCIGEEVQKLAATLPDGGVLLLEDVIFYEEEEKNDPEFAKMLAALGDLYCNDAFGTAHRAHTSTEGMVKSLRPVVAVAFGTAAAAAALALSLVYKVAKGVFLMLPTDVIAADKFDADANSKDEQVNVLPQLDPSRVDFDINFLLLIKNEDLKQLERLGSGTFGEVYHGKWRGKDVAIKRIKKRCFTGRSSKQERQCIEVWREAAILSKLDHPNVVTFYGVVQDGPGGTPTTVTEFMVDGSLRDVLLREDRHLDHWKRLILAMDAASGMEYLHSENVVHFDLKSDNLLVNLKDPSRPICKVGDFGLSKIKRNTLLSGGVRGTLPWMAPELLNGSSHKVSEKVDVYSFGIVLWEILTGEEPYADMHYGAILGGIVGNTLRPPIPSPCDPEWKTLMEQCWASDPMVRPSFTEIAGRLRALFAATASAATASAAAALAAAA